MHITRSIVVPAAALALAVGAAYAADDQQSRDMPNFNQMDKNNDGALTRSEAAANPRLAAHFDKVDDNGDGKLSRGEYLAIMAREDLHTARDAVAEFIDPEDKPPLAREQQSASSQSASSPSGEASAGQSGASNVPGAASQKMVRNVQQKLDEAGVNPGPVDGIWGPRTHQAVREFQKREGLEATGQLNSRTLAALEIGQESASAGASASAGGSKSAGGSQSAGGTGSAAGGSAPTFQSADRNNDGQVDRQEFNRAFDSQAR